MDVVVCIIHFIADDSIMRSLHEMFPLFPQLFLCLSQACLGELIVSSIKAAAKGRLLFVPVALTAAVALRLSSSSAVAPPTIGFA